MDCMASADLYCYAISFDFSLKLSWDSSKASLQAMIIKSFAHLSDEAVSSSARETGRNSQRKLAKSVENTVKILFQ